MLYSLTVFFEDPWWVWLFTISDESASQYCWVVFGNEPADTEVYQYFLNNYNQLKFTDGIPAMPENPVNGNPKRRKREISKQLKSESQRKRARWLQVTKKDRKKKGQTPGTLTIWSRRNLPEYAISRTVLLSENRFLKVNLCVHLSWLENIRN